jgi:hypothetical protein
MKCGVTGGGGGAGFQLLLLLLLLVAFSPQPLPTDSGALSHPVGLSQPLPIIPDLSHALPEMPGLSHGLPDIPTLSQPLLDIPVLSQALLLLNTAGFSSNRGVVFSIRSTCLQRKFIYQQQYKVFKNKIKFK